MLENIEIKRFLEGVAKKQNGISDTVTLSKHKHLALKILNEVIAEHPEWELTITALCDYTRQKWAYENRISYGKELNIFKTISYDFVEKYEFTLDIIELIDKAVIDEFFRLKIFTKPEFEAFEAIHDLNADDVSKYMINNYYKSAVIRFCEAYDKKINRLTRKMHRDYVRMKSDDALVFHDTDILLKTLRYILQRKTVLSDINKDDLCELIVCCLSRLKEYPFSGETMEKIMRMYIFENMSDQKIGQKLGASETFVRAKRTTATEIISILLWGYSSRTMLKNAGSK